MFTDEDPNELEKEYRFSEWYPTIHEVIFTPKSWIMKYEDLFNGNVDELIATLPGKCCFARLDHASAKPKKPYFTSQEIIESFQKSDRCSSYFTNDMPVIIREYLILSSEEFRCFVHDKKFRAISTESEIPDIDKVRRLVDKLTFYSEYESYCADFTFYNGELMLIEINTPVWLFATSGLFDLDVPYDREILCGEYQGELIDYPVVRI